MDLVRRAAELKGMLVDFGLSSRFALELSAAVEREFPGGVVTDEGTLTLVVDHFLLQHRLRSGATVVELFVAEHPELDEAEREMLLGWRDVVEGVFEITGKDRDAALLLNHVDELVYRARSNMGARAFRPMKRGMILIGRLVRVGGDWMLSGNPVVFPASMSERLLAVAAKQALRHPEAVFRNPAKLAQARSMVASQREAFIRLFGADLIVRPGGEVADAVSAFYRLVAEEAGVRESAADGGWELPSLGLPDDVRDSDGVAIHFSEGEGLSFYPHYRLLEELFDDPALILRRRHREALSGFLRDPELSPEPLRRLAARDPAKAGRVFGAILKRKRGFSWDEEGEQLLRKHKPSYFDGSRLPRNVPLSAALSEALRQARQSDVAEAAGV